MTGSFEWYLVYGQLAAVTMVLWGIYGDLLLEPFSFTSAIRSLLFGLIGSIFLYWVNSNLPPIIVIFNVVAIERTFTEVYKALIRKEKQSKYHIPSTLKIRFPFILERVFGIIFLATLLFLFKFYSFHTDWVMLLLLAALLPGIGGALKDAPYEGFDRLKFFRSPIVILIVGIVLKRLFPNLEDKYFLLSLWGAERIISECYKKIINGHVPGKFRRDLHHHLKPSWKTYRKILLVPYCACLTVIVFIASQSVN